MKFTKKATSSMKKILILILLIITTLTGFAQTPSLEFSTASGPAGSGPATTDQVITFRQNTDNPTANAVAAFTTPTITATFALINQRFTMTPTPSVGLSFGATINGASANAASNALFPLMSAISSPTDNMFTSLRTITATTGITAASNNAVAIFTSTRPLFDGDSLRNGRYYYGDLIITFSTPVNNPVIHVVGLGGAVGTTPPLGLTTELELITPNTSISKLSGNTNLLLSGLQILNSATNPTASSVGGAATGSILVTGDNLKTLTFKVYMEGDGVGSTWNSTTTQHSGDLWLMGVSLETPITLSGNVYNDTDGTTNINGTGTGTPGGTQVYATLVDGLGKTVQSMAVAAGGAYSFTGTFAGNYTMQLSTTLGTQGTTAPTVSVPAGWGYIGEDCCDNVGNDGTANGIVAINVGISNLSNVNFGIKSCPTPQCVPLMIQKL